MNDHPPESGTPKKPISAAQARRLQRLRELSGARTNAELAAFALSFLEWGLDACFKQSDVAEVQKLNKKLVYPHMDFLQHATELGRPKTAEELEEERPLMEAKIIELTAFRK